MQEECINLNFENVFAVERNGMKEEWLYFGMLIFN